MRDEEKTREQLLEEIGRLRNEAAELHSLTARQKEMEDSLRQSIEKYQIHFSLANDVMFSYDTQFRIISVSPNVERILGYKPEELIGGTFHGLNVLHPDCMELAVTNALKVLSGNTVYSSIYKFIAKDGTIKFGEVSGVPRMEDGQVIGSVTVARDITHRMEMERSLQENEERYRLTLQTMPDAVCIVRVDDVRFLYSNEAFFKITGYTPQESIGKTPFDLDLPVDLEVIDHCLDLMRHNEAIDSIECRCRKKDGTVIDAIVSASPILYSKEHCMVVAMKEVTSLKQLAEERKRLEIQSQKMESIGTLAGGIAHDFNNLLTTILGYTKMTLKDITDRDNGIKDLASVRSDLGEVRKAALRARDLVNHILAFSRHTETKYEPMVLGEAVRKSLKVLRPTLPANIKLHEDLKLPGRILGDEAQMHQVLTNLCSNAVHAMKDTGGTIEVVLSRVGFDEGAAKSHADVPPGSYLKLSVRDTGHGMTNTVMVRIFDPYFTTRFSGRGAGLGLSVVHGIVKSHGGTITCRSIPGEGTTFEIFLPELDPGGESASAGEDRDGALEDKMVLNLDEGRSPDRPAGRKQDLPGASAKPKDSPV